jgi:hypothetical protein
MCGHGHKPSVVVVCEDLGRLIKWLVAKIKGMSN